MKMTNFILSLLCALSFTACQKEDESTQPVPEKKEVLEIEVLPIESEKAAAKKPSIINDRNGFFNDFKYITFDKANLFNSLQQYVEAIYIRDSIALPPTDFENNSLIAVTGLSPVTIDTIVPTLYRQGDKYTLDIHLIAAEKNLSAMKWNLFLRVPKIDDDKQIDCDITLPEEGLSLARTVGGEYYGLVKNPSTYCIIYDSVYKNDIRDAVNADDSCSMYTSSGAYAFEFGEWKEVYGKKALYSILCNCDYDNVIAPLGDKILFASCGYSQRPEYLAFEAYYYYLKPTLSPVYSSDKEFGKLQELLKYTGSKLCEFDNGVNVYDFIHLDLEKINSINMFSIIALHYYSQILTPFRFSFYQMKYYIDHMKKIRYE